MATNTLYFRINPIFDKLIELDEVVDCKIINLLWETKRFMYLKRSEIERIASYLKKFTLFSTDEMVDDQTNMAEINQNRSNISETETIGAKSSGKN